MTHQVEETFYQLRPISPELWTEYEPSLRPWLVEEVIPQDDNGLQARITGFDPRTVFRGTFSQCKAWLDERPGSAISIASD